MVCNFLKFYLEISLSQGVMFTKANNCFISFTYFILLSIMFSCHKMSMIFITLPLFYYLRI